MARVVGERVAFLRRQKGDRNGEQLCKFAGITRGMLGDIEAGKTEGSLKTIEKVAQFLGVSIDELRKKEIPMSDDKKDAKRPFTIGVSAIGGPDAIGGDDDGGDDERLRRASDEISSLSPGPLKSILVDAVVAISKASRPDVK